MIAPGNASKPLVQRSLRAWLAPRRSRNRGLMAAKRAPTAALLAGEVALHGHTKIIRANGFGDESLTTYLAI